MLYDPTRPRGEQLGAPDTILRGIPKGSIHNGGRIAFGPDGMLYAGTGETGDRGLAQDMTSLAGKILRMTPGRASRPQDNPTAGLARLLPRPPQRPGPRLGRPRARLWASEFGQDTWDELNLIEPGGNYGWPVVEGIAHRARLRRPDRPVAHRRRLPLAASPTRRAPSGWRPCTASGCGGSPSTGTKAAAAAAGVPHAAVRAAADGARGRRSHGAG